MRQRLKDYWVLRQQTKEAQRLKDAGREVCDNHPHLSAHFTTANSVEDVLSVRHWCTDCFVKEYLTP